MNSEEMVREFHEKHTIHIGAVLRKDWNESLYDAGKIIRGISMHLFNEYTETKDDRLLRAHLIFEESFETIDALLYGNEVLLLDALADLQYVTEGTAVTFGLPLKAAFVEVHRSNMTKKVGDIRIRDKGKDYSPPNIEEVLRCSRQ